MFYGIAVTFEHDGFFRHILEERVVAHSLECMHTELPLRLCRHFGADMVRPHLKPEADAECRDAEVEYRFVERRRVHVDEGGAAGEDEAGRCDFLYVRGGNRRGVGHYAKNAELCELLHNEVVELRP